MSILYYVAVLVSFVCWILVLIKLFQDKENNGVLHGIIGIVTCGIWAFIWGWIHHGRLGIKNVMIIWTIAWIVSGATMSSVMNSALNA